MTEQICSALLLVFEILMALANCSPDRRRVVLRFLASSRCARRLSRCVLAWAWRCEEMRACTTPTTSAGMTACTSRIHAEYNTFSSCTGQLSMQISYRTTSWNLNGSTTCWKPFFYFKLLSYEGTLYVSLFVNFKIYLNGSYYFIH